MKHGLCFFLIFCLFTVTGFSQNESGYISGYVYDVETKQALPDVNIYTEGNTVGGTTNKDGYFRVKIEKYPSLIYFSHVSYKIKQFIVEKSSKKELEIFLEPDIRKLGEVLVSGKKIVKLFRKQDLYLLDYEIQGNYLIFLANVDKNPRDSRLYLATLAGDTISSRQIQQPGNSYQDIIGITHNIFLFKDCFGEVHICTKDKVWQIYLKEKKIWLIYPSSFAEFFGYLQPIRTFIEGKYYYQIASTTIVNSYYDKMGNQARVKISSVVGPRPRGVRPRLQKAPLFNLNDTVILFDFFKNRIDFFSKDDEHLKATPISFHNKTYQYLVFFKTEEINHDFWCDVVMDKVLNKFYAVFEKGGVYILHEIDIHSGEIVRIIKIPQHPFIDKIRVNNGVVYFLYQSKLPPYYMSLYRMRL